MVEPTVRRRRLCLDLSPPNLEVGVGLLQALWGQRPVGASTTARQACMIMVQEHVVL